MTLYEFYGDECPHCEKMEPVVDEVEEEEDVEIQRLEVWNDRDNAKKQYELDQDDSGDKLCGGVPFFYNTETDEWICGEADKEELKAWATGS
ncbi:MAG: hypothetical protein ABEJ72_03490 [Candidatus Aenigmatarchaeota archaeon]